MQPNLLINKTTHSKHLAWVHDHCIRMCDELCTCLTCLNSLLTWLCVLDVFVGDDTVSGAQKGSSLGAWLARAAQTEVHYFIKCLHLFMTRYVHIHRHISSDSNHINHNINNTNVLSRLWVQNVALPATDLARSTLPSLNNEIGPRALQAALVNKW